MEEIDGSERGVGGRKPFLSGSVRGGDGQEQDEFDRMMEEYEGAGKYRAGVQHAWQTDATVEKAR